MRIFDAGAVRVDGSRWLGAGEQSTALNQFFSADSIGEKAEVANADQAGGQHVEQEAANELDRIQGHGLGAGVIRVVFPVKADAAVFQSAFRVAYLLYAPVGLRECRNSWIELCAWGRIVIAVVWPRPAGRSRLP